jgi:hypothetical protein
LLTSRQLWCAAIFGGLGFAAVALDLNVPILPPMILDLRAVFWILGVAGSGPVGAIFIGLLMGLPSAFPLATMTHVVIYGLVFCVLYRKIYFMRGIVRYVFLAVWAAVSVYAGDLILIVVSTYVYHVFPDVMIGLEIYSVASSRVWAVAAALSIVLLARFAPEYAEPTWSLSRPEGPK